MCCKLNKPNYRIVDDFARRDRQVDDCRPGRGGMAQGGRTRGETFHGEIDRCGESQGWTTAYTFTLPL